MATMLAQRPARSPSIGCSSRWVHGSSRSRVGIVAWLGARGSDGLGEERGRVCDGGRPGGQAEMGQL